jgi:hypothetical protein
MTGLIVPQLSRKLHLLITYGHHPSLEAVAKALGRSPITLRGWVHGGSGTVPDRVPPQLASRFVDLYRQALPGLTPEQIRALLLGPADDLEALFAAKAAPSFMNLVEREADWTSGTVCLDEGGSFSLVQTNKGRRRAPACRIELVF